MNILAFDLATQCGWALQIADRTCSGTESFATKRHEGGGMRYLRFRRFLGELKARAGHIDAVYYEAVERHVGTTAAHVYGGLVATLTAWCEHHQIPYQGLPVGTIKRHATGSGNASKDAMLAAARAQGFNPADHNEADALAILSLGRTYLRERC